MVREPRDRHHHQHNYVVFSWNEAHFKPEKRKHHLFLVRHTAKSRLMQNIASPTILQCAKEKVGARGMPHNNSSFLIQVRYFFDLACCLHWHKQAARDAGNCTDKCRGC